MHILTAKLHAVSALRLKLDVLLPHKKAIPVLPFVNTF